MILHDRLAATGDEDELLGTGGGRFLQRVLDDRPVDDRQHLLGQHLGRGQHARAETGHRKHDLADLPHAFDLTCPVTQHPARREVIAAATVTVQPQPS